VPPPVGGAAGRFRRTGSHPHRGKDAAARASFVRGALVGGPGREANTDKLKPACLRLAVAAGELQPWRARIGRMSFSKWNESAATPGRREQHREGERTAGSRRVRAGVWRAGGCTSPVFRQEGHLMLVPRGLSQSNNWFPRMKRVAAQGWLFNRFKVAKMPIRHHPETGDLTELPRPSRFVTCNFVVVNPRSRSLHPTPPDDGGSPPLCPSAPDPPTRRLGCVIGLRRPPGLAVHPSLRTGPRRRLVSTAR